VSPEFVLRIPEMIYSEQENVREYDYSKDSIQYEIFVFEKDSAHLANICTDVLIMNYPKPKRKIKNVVQGKIKVFIGNKEVG